MTMHEKFADWYRRVDLSPTPEVLQRRWSSVESLAQGLNSDGVLALVSLFVGAPTTDSHGRIKGFVATLKASDPTFPTEGNDALLHVMFAAALACIIARGGGSALVAGLAARTSNCQGVGLRAEPDVLAEAEQFLSSEGVGARHRATSSGPEPAPTKALPGKTGSGKSDGKAALVDVTEFSHAIANDKALGDAIAAVAATVENLRGAVTTLQQRVQQQDASAEVLKEEAEVLWWLFAGRSRALGLDFSALPMPAGSLVIASELAARTRVLPAPPSLDGFLAKALGSNGTTTCTIDRLVSTVPPDWSGAIARVPPWTHRNAITPVHAALQLRSDWSEADWLQLLAKVTLLKPESELSCASWARQFYDELLLVQAVSRAQV